MTMEISAVNKVKSCVKEVPFTYGDTEGLINAGVFADTKEACQEHRKSQQRAVFRPQLNMVRISLCGKMLPD